MIKRILIRGARMLVMGGIGALGGAYAAAQIVPPTAGSKAMMSAVISGAIIGVLAALDKAIRDSLAAADEKVGQ